MDGTKQEAKLKGLLWRSRGVGWYGVRLLVLAALYVGAGRAGLLLGAVSGFATLVWVPSGLAVAALFLWGSAWWPAITLGAFLVDFLTGAPWFVAVGTSIGCTLEALLCVALLKRWKVRSALDLLQDVLVLVLLAAPTSALVSATLGVGSLWLGGVINWSAVPVTWGTWWLGDLMSLLLLLPFLLTWSARLRVPLSRKRLMELSLLSVSVLVIGLFVFLGLLRPNYWEYPVTQFAFPLLIVFPLLIWGALRFGPRGATALIITFASLATVGTILGVSPFSTGSLWQRLLFLQSFLGITAATTLILAAIGAERQALEQRTRDALGALVAMGEALVQVQPVTNPAEPTSEAPVAMAVEATQPKIARRLAELTRSVLGCRRVSIAAVDAATGLLAPITEVGLPPEQAQAWWASWSPPQRAVARYGAAIAALLYAGETALLDTRHLPERYHYTLYQARTGRMTPMRMGEELVGMLFVDYGEDAHAISSQEEIMLTETMARLGALVLERDRLLRRWAEAHASALALRATKEQMDIFLSIASHELKGPLTSLKLSLQLTERRLHKFAGDQHGAAAERDATLQPVLAQHQRATHQVTRLERLVNDLLDVSRIQAGKLELRPEPADLAAILRGAVEEQQQAAPERTIRLQCPAALQVPVVADSGRIEQVVTNYLTNALKYSAANRPVDVGVQMEQRQARVWVRDQGPGLPAEEQERIWEHFHRAPGIEVQSGTGVGLGLGLAICREIIERQQGQVGVQSTLGQGSTFWFTLPIGVHAEGDQRAG